MIRKYLYTIVHLVLFKDSRTVIPFAGFGGSRERINSGGSDNVEKSGAYLRRATSASTSPPPAIMYAQSPSNMEGPITFVAPELSEETLMDVSCSLRTFVVQKITIHP